MLPKLVYVVLQLLTMALGLYKCSAMGLLPTATSDWLAFMEPKQVKFKEKSSNSKSK